MVRSGSWLIPENDGIPRLVKPPLLYWTLAASMKIFGVNEFAARVPNALAVTFWVGVTFLIGAQMGGNRADFSRASSCSHRSAPSPSGESSCRSPLFSAFIAAALYCALRGPIMPTSPRVVFRILAFRLAGQLHKRLARYCSIRWRSSGWRPFCADRPAQACADWFHGRALCSSRSSIFPGIFTWNLAFPATFTIFSLPSSLAMSPAPSRRLRPIPMFLGGSFCSCSWPGCFPGRWRSSPPPPSSRFISAGSVYVAVRVSRALIVIAVDGSHRRFGAAHGTTTRLLRHVDVARLCAGRRMDAGTLAGSARDRPPRNACLAPGSPARLVPCDSVLALTLLTTAALAERATAWTTIINFDRRSGRACEPQPGSRSAAALLFALLGLVFRRSKLKLAAIGRLRPSALIWVQ